MKTKIELYTKPPENLCLLNKLVELVLVRVLLHDWSNFDLPKLKPVEHISLMPSSCLSLTLINARIHAKKVTHYESGNQEFADASVCRNEQKGVLIAGVSYPLSPISLPFYLRPYPLPLSTPATHARNKGKPHYFHLQMILNRSF